MSDIIEYVKDMKKKGYDDGSIRLQLISNGYHPDNVNEIFQKMEHSSGGLLNPIFIIVGVVVLVIIIGLIAMFMIGSDDGSDSVSDSGENAEAGEGSKDETGLAPEAEKLTEGCAELPEKIRRCEAYACNLTLAEQQMELGMIVAADGELCNFTYGMGFAALGCLLNDSWKQTMANYTDYLLIASQKKEEELSEAENMFYSDILASAIEEGICVPIVQENMNPGRFLPEKCEIAPGLTCMDFNAKNNTVVVLVNNGIGQEMVDVNVSLDSCSNDASDIEPLLSEGQTIKFEITCDGLVAGERYKSDFVLNYNTVFEGETLMHMKKGYIVVDVG